MDYTTKDKGSDWERPGNTAEQNQTNEMGEAKLDTT